MLLRTLVLVVSPALLILLLLSGCASQPAPDQAEPSRLAPCPSSPNCASTAQSSTDPIDTPILAIPAEQAWPAVIAAVNKLPRTTITHQGRNYLRAESRSWLFRFTDDLEIIMDAGNHQLAMRSASRLGYSDLGVNARRLQTLIDHLQSQGIVK